MRNLYSVVLVMLSVSTHDAYSMRRTIASGGYLIRPLLVLRQQNLSTRPLHQNNRLLSETSNSHLPNWHFKECYKQLQVAPSDSKTFNMVKEQTDYTKQTLLRAVALDPAMAPRALVTLLHAGAQLNEVDSEGQTPLHLLAQSSKQHYDETSFLELLAHIAHFKPNFDAKDKYGKTPADYATKELQAHFKAHEPICPTKLNYMYR